MEKELFHAFQALKLKRDAARSFRTGRLITAVVAGVFCLFSLFSIWLWPWDGWPRLMWPVFLCVAGWALFSEREAWFVERDMQHKIDNLFADFNVDADSVLGGSFHVSKPILHHLLFWKRESQKEP